MALQVNLFPLSSRVKPEIFNSAIFSFGIFSPPKNHSYSSISGFPEPKHCETNVSSWVKESAARWTAISGLPKFQSLFCFQIYITFKNTSVVIRIILVPISSTTPQFNTSLPHKRATLFQPRKSLSATPKTLQFHTKNPSVPHQKRLSSTPRISQFQSPLSSTLKTLQFNTPLSSTLITPQTKNSWEVCWTEGFLVWNWGVFGMELRFLWCWTEGFFGCLKGVVLMWNRCVEVRGSVQNWGVLVSFDVQIMIKMFWWF